MPCAPGRRRASRRRPPTTRKGAPRRTRTRCPRRPRRAGTRPASTRWPPSPAGPPESRAACGGSVFKGLPYADSTAGAARRHPPRPASSWAGVRAAASGGPACRSRSRVSRTTGCPSSARTA
ncbi:carboxylesterase family protein [Streptomyces sp. NPDC059224]|uniref:carboxylesterase family protein n=1 Tax=Streptomyces sp. NPDC059224 TaxID=3346775 RepID=UPI00367A30E8